MAPTHGFNVEIEGRYEERKAYKERAYAYSPVPESGSSTVCESTTLRKQNSKNGQPPTVFERENYYGVHKCPVRYNGNMKENGSQMLQYLAAAAANLCSTTAGAMMGWTSPILPRLSTTTEDNPLGRIITSDENSWIGSLVAVGAMMGCFIAGILADRFGRKLTLLSSSALYMVGWALIAAATNVEMLYIARIILGFAMSFTFAVVPMYCGEIAEISIRGRLGSFLQLFITVGLLYAYVIGPFVSYMVFCILCAILAIIFFAAFVTMPESPFYLLKAGRRDEALAALARLRGKSESGVQKECDEIQAEVDETLKNVASIMDLIRVKATFKAALYTSLLAAFQQLSGINVVLFYMESIFIAAGTTLKTSVATIIVGLVQMLSSGITPIVVDKLGRKMLLIFSGIGEIVTLAALGAYFYMKDAQKQDVSSIAILPVVALVIFIATYCVGWGPLPWTVMGEMLPSNAKSKVSGIAVCSCWFLAFLITKFSNNLSTALGNYTLYWLFSGFSLVSVMFTILVLPETKGKSLQQIQNELEGDKKSSDFETGGKM